MGHSGFPQAIERSYAGKANWSRRLPLRSIKRYRHDLSSAAQIAWWRAVAPARWRLIECLFTHSKADTSSAESMMEIPKYALDILVCPICKTRVELLSDGSGLKCVTCRRVYPVRDEIPVMLPEEAKIAEE
jgi:uncharacterized protein YbaR (Trm112 family)